MSTLKIISSITPINFKQAEPPVSTSHVIQQPMPKNNTYTVAGEVGLVVAAGVLLGAAAKFAPRIKAIFKHFAKKPNVETDKYMLIKEDIYSEKYINNKLDKSYFTEATLSNSTPAPNGVFYTFPEGSQTADIHIKQFVNKLKQYNWEIVEIPPLDKSKITGTDTTHDKHLGEYMMLLHKIFNNAAEKYEQTGQKTAIILRRLDSITGNRKDILKHHRDEFYKHEYTEALLRLTDNLSKRGCTWITDAPTNANLDAASIRVGRLDRCVLLPPLKHDSQEVWGNFLEQQYTRFKYAEKQINTYGYNPYLNGTTWRLQYAIDNFPKEYQESSQLYQELKNTKFYPDKYKELVDNAPPMKKEENWRDVHRRNQTET